MKEIIFSIIPFVVMAICIGIILANKGRMKKKTHMLLGMCAGYSIGTAIGTGAGHGGIGGTLGMLLGMTIGMFLEDNESEE